MNEQHWRPEGKMQTKEAHAHLKAEKSLMGRNILGNIFKLWKRKKSKCSRGRNIVARGKVDHVEGRNENLHIEIEPYQRVEWKMKTVMFLFSGKSEMGRGRQSWYDSRSQVQRRFRDLPPNRAELPPCWTTSVCLSHMCSSALCSTS